MSTGASSRDVQTILVKLDAVLQSLPTELEKEELGSKLRTLIEFLQSVESQLAAMPTNDDFPQARHALNALRDLVESAKTNPLVAQTLGIRMRATQRTGRSKKGTPQNKEAKERLDRLRQLPIEATRERLQHEPLPLLRAMASVLGIGSPEKLGKDALVHHVGAKIANYRGYRGLSGQQEAESPPSTAPLG